ncbi:hypothetical protein DEM27_29060 [Metarhizobium album]|uniref:VCBS repeat-containing protein n=1 Tax=Metarhizobium album TaxID=2182425 RepID=A0A2U2DHS3_9HYPH|nr:hypothetical protein [Rhizobium album]PWE52849.1 hypothetical protein DEM27_29060 [Rhizobium album]
MIRALLAAVALVTGTSAALAAEPIAPERIIDAVTGDWNKDDQSDLALLVAPAEGEDMIGIYIYVRDKDHPLLKLVAEAPGKIWGNSSLDGMFGQDPSLTALANGSIAVHSQNSGIGRNRWEQRMTLAYRNGDFVVAGYTYNDYDTLDPNAGTTCDYNVLTGKAKVNDKELRVEPKFITIQDWDDTKDRGPCSSD